MFIAMNRFRVNPERTQEFETLWLERETHLQDLPGFIELHMLRGPEEEDHVLYASHTIWRSREDFDAWTHSEAFRAAHANAGQNRRDSTWAHPNSRASKSCKRSPEMTTATEQPCFLIPSGHCG